MSGPLQFDEHDRVAILKLTGLAGAHGLIKVRVCPICALPVRYEVDAALPDSFQATLSIENCDSCVDFGERHPDTFRWITRIIAGQELLARWRKP